VGLDKRKIATAGRLVRDKDKLRQSSHMGWIFWVSRVGVGFGKSRNRKKV
jgi:hypothetical protein